MKTIGDTPSRVEFHSTGGNNNKQDTSKIVSNLKKNKGKLQVN